MPARKLWEEEYYEVPHVPQQQKQAVVRKYIKRNESRREAARKAHVRSKLIVLFLAVILMTSAVMARYSIIAAKGFDIVQMRTEAAKLEAENAKLRISNAQLKDPNRIKQIAETQLGMTVSDKFYFAEGRADQ